MSAAHTPTLRAFLAELAFRESAPLAVASGIRADYDEAHQRLSRIRLDALSKDDAAHIVRCVNAWDDAESLRLRLIELNPAANDDHDELVAALRQLESAASFAGIEDRQEREAVGNALQSARAALAKATA